MIENLGLKSPGTETGGRKTVLSDSSDVIELNGKRGQHRCLRRKRVGLRRYKSAENLQSGFPERDRSSKRKRSENSKLLLMGKKQSYENEECSAVISFSLPSPLSNEGLTSAKIVIPAGTSDDVIEDNISARENGNDVIRCWSHGSISLIGRRREMEDAVAVEPGCLRRGSKEYDFFGVYDGHGGSRVAHDCRDRLHKVLMEILEKEDEEISNRGGVTVNWNKVMLQSFEKIDEEVNKSGAAVATMGSTAVVGDEEVVVANCGDSRAVLSRGGVAVPLSTDHKPDRSDELERIEHCGGKVINWNGERVLGVLATSRSIGDHYLKPYVISDPEVIVTKRTRRDEFLILATDGLWDVVSNDVACHFVRRCFSGQIKRGVVVAAADNQVLMNGKKSYGETDHTAAAADDDDSILMSGCCRARRGNNPTSAATAAALLAELAIARGSRDNISVIVVELRRDYIVLESILGACRISFLGQPK